MVLVVGYLVVAAVVYAGYRWVDREWCLYLDTRYPRSTTRPAPKADDYGLALLLAALPGGWLFVAYLVVRLYFTGGFLCGDNWKDVGGRPLPH